jgi:alpha-D-ribose 1-methylphosphonate 5-triphosphate synthase subunit PhnI
MYIAAKGGEAAIQESEALFHRLKGPITPSLIAGIRESLPYLVDRVMGEASLYEPTLAALAIAQAGGDLYEAVLLLRAYRSTQPRLAYAAPVSPDRLFTVRRISASFKDIPGGQVLGPSLDYSHRILDLDRLDRPDAARDTAPDAERAEPADRPLSAQYPLVADWQRMQGLAAPLPPAPTPHGPDMPDLTRDPVMFPAPREHRLQALARADTGGVLSLGYASMRGYGLIHPTVNELRLAHAEVTVTHPITGEAFSAGRVRVSQGEVATTDAGGGALQLGFTATLGWNEVKLIAGATLDLEMNHADAHPAHQEEFVLYHTEIVEASGFCIHFKLPHYVTFASSLDNLRRVISTFYSGDSQEASGGEIPAEGETAPAAEETPAPAVQETAP